MENSEIIKMQPVDREVYYSGLKEAISPEKQLLRMPYESQENASKRFKELLKQASMETGDDYIHTRTGGKYFIEELAELKFNGKRVPVVTYRALDTWQLYVRTLPDFEAKFTKR